MLWTSNSAVLEHLVTEVMGGVEAVKGSDVVELGAGVGCLGIGLAMGGANAMVTDLKELAPLMAENVVRNAAAVTTAPVNTLGPVWRSAARTAARGSMPARTPSLRRAITCTEKSMPSPSNTATNPDVMMLRSS